MKARRLIPALALMLAPLTVQAEPVLKDTAGVSHRLSEQKDKWVLVNFWAPWCTACRSEMPELSGLQSRHPDVLVLGVAILYERPQAVRDAVKALSPSYPIVLGNEDLAGEFGEIRGLPVSFLIAPGGRLLGRHDGPLTRREIEAAMAGAAGAAFTP